MAHHHDHEAFIQANKDHHNAPGHAHAYSESTLTKYTAQNCAKAILKTVALKEGLSVLDYACGPGLVSIAIREQAESSQMEIVGVDLSQKMVDEFNSKVKQADIPSPQMYALQKDVLQDADSELSGKLFDLVICVQTYHHIPDTAALTLALARRLKKGGTFCVIDMDSESGFPQMIARKTDVKNVVVHKRGFSESDLQEILTKSGQFSNIKVEESHSMTTEEMKGYGEVGNWGKGLEGPNLTIRWLIASGVKI